jgi:hypothetical protein
MVKLGLGFINIKIPEEIKQVLAKYTMDTENDGEDAFPD